MRRYEFYFYMLYVWKPSIRFCKEFAKIGSKSAEKFKKVVDNSKNM